jgi:drug/metabolite transporter (DMT)-like permease
MASDPVMDVRGVTEAPLSRILTPLITLWIVWGSTYMGIALVVQSMPPLMGAGTRFLAATVVLAIVVLVIRGPSVFRVTGAQFRGAVFMGVFILSVGIGILSLAQRYVPSSIAALIVSVMPLWIIVFRVKAGDRPSRLTFVGVGIGLLGLALMLLPGGTEPVGGASASQVAIWSLAIAFGSFCWAFFSWRSTRYEQPQDALVTTVIEMLTASVVLTLVGLFLGERWVMSEYTSASWAGWGFLVVASAVAYSAYVWLIGNAPMSLVSTYAYVNPVIAVLLGFFILSEPITSDVILGLTIVVGGVVLVVSGERRPKQLIQEPT